MTPRGSLHWVGDVPGTPCSSLIGSASFDRGTQCSLGTCLVPKKAHQHPWTTRTSNPLSAPTSQPGSHPKAQGRSCTPYIHPLKDPTLTHSPSHSDLLTSSSSTNCVLLSATTPTLLVILKENTLTFQFSCYPDLSLGSQA